MIHIHVHVQGAKQSNPPFNKAYI